MLGRTDGGEFGVEGRRKGEALGPPNDNGDGLKPGLLDCMTSKLISVKVARTGLRHTIA